MQKKALRVIVKRLQASYEQLKKSETGIFSKIVRLIVMSNISIPMPILLKLFVKASVMFIKLCPAFKVGPWILSALIYPC